MNVKTMQVTVPVLVEMNQKLQEEIATMHAEIDELEKLLDYMLQYINPTDRESVKILIEKHRSR